MERLGVRQVLDGVCGRPRSEGAEGKSAPSARAHSCGREVSHASRDWTAEPSFSVLVFSVGHIPFD
eukprot:3734693-Pleurochrysis_carterae.AAC.2